MNAFAIVKSILRKSVSASRLVYRDTESYLGILLDDNNRKWICRIGTDKKLSMMIPDEDKKVTKINLDSLDDIYNHSDALLNVLNRYL